MATAPTMVVIAEKLAQLADKLEESTQHDNRNTAEMWTAIGLVRSGAQDIFSAGLALQAHHQRHPTEEEE